MTCVGAHDTDPPLAHHGLLCGRCHGRLAQALSDIATLYPLLEELLIPGSVNGGGTRGKPGSRPACDLDVADLRDARGTVHAEVSGWARIVIEERQLAARPLDVEQSARLLTIHLDWISEQPWVDEALREIGDAAWTIRRVCHDLPEPPIGTCPDVDPRGQADVCGGPLRIEHVAQFGSDTALYVVCSRCGSRWDARSLIHLGRVAPMNLWESVTNIAAMLDIPDRTVRHWAATGKIRRDSLGQVNHADAWRHASRDSQAQDA